MKSYLVCLEIGTKRSARVIVEAADEADAEQRATAYLRERREVFGTIHFVKEVVEGSVLARSRVAVAV